MRCWAVRLRPPKWCVWLLTNLLFVMFWVAYVHRKLIPGIHLDWLLGDVLKVLAPGVVVALLISALDVQPAGVINNLLFVIGAGLAIFMTMILVAYYQLKLSLFDELKRHR